MRLLYVCTDFGIPPDGTKGASIHLRAITRALCELGHEVSLLSPREGPGKDHPLKRLLAPGGSPASEWPDHLRTWLKVHDLPHTLAEELRTLLYNVSAVPRALELLTPNPPDAIIERLSLFGHLGLDLATVLQRPFFVEVNALLSREAQRFRGLQLTELAQTIERRVLQHSSGIFAVSEGLVPQLASAGATTRAVHVVPNGAFVERFDPAFKDPALSARFKPRGEFIVGFVGSLKVWHGVDVLISAFKLLHSTDPHTRLLIVGSGPMETDLHSASRRHGLNGSVVFAGAVDHGEVPRFLSIMDVAVAPFRMIDDFYFSPIKVFEYMAAGRCVVASRLGQIQHVISDGANGILCRPDDAASLAQALLTARLDDGLRRRLGAAARHAAVTKHTWGKAASTISRIVDKCVRHNCPGPKRSATAPTRPSEFPTK